MNSSNVIEMNLDKIQQSTKPKLIMGLIPCQNRFYLDRVWPIILPGIQKLSIQSRGEWDIYKVWKDILFGSLQLYIAYVEREDKEISEDNFQDIMIEKLKTPEKDYVGFSIIQLQDSCVHVFAAFVVPEFNRTNMMALGLSYLEKQAKNLGAPYLQVITQPDGDGVPCTTMGYLERLGYEHASTVYRKKLKL